MVYNNLIGNSIYIPQYSGRKELKNLKGKFKTIKKFKFNVIGILKEGNINKTENYNKCIYPEINYYIGQFKKNLLIKMILFYIKVILLMIN